MKNNNVFLLERYFNAGKLKQRYYDGKSYCQPYSAEDRLLAGKMFYEDFLSWQKNARLIRNYEAIKVDVSLNTAGGFSKNTERFRRALKRLPKASLEVVYQIVLCENDIMAPPNFNERERAFFYDDIKGLLCRGLDELCRFYAPVRLAEFV